MAETLPVLLFHALDDRPSPLSFRPEVFRRAMGRLREAGWRTLRLIEVAGHLERGEPFPPRRVVLTFDDGYRSVHDEALPVLVEHGFTATVFLLVGRESATGDADRLPSFEGREMLSWGEIRAMRSAGIDFGAHTLTHPDLTALEAGAIEEEVEGSGEAIERALGSPVECFAYPFGLGDARSRAAVSRRYRLAVSTRLGLVTPRSDPLRLERVEAFYLRTERLFSTLFSPTLAWYLRLRNVPRRIRRLFVHPARSGGA